MRLLGAVTGAGLVLAGVAGYLLVTHLTGGRAGSGSDGVSRTAAEKVPLVLAAGLAQRSGVRITQVAVTGAGGLVDLRYLVVDPDRAAVVHEATPVIVDEET